MSAIQKFLDRCLPQSLHQPDANADHRRRARVVAGFSLSLGVISIAMSLGALAMGMWHNAIGTFFGFPIAAVLFWRLRQGTSVRILGAATGGTLFLTAVQGAIVLGGIGTPPATWLCVIPLIVVLVSGPRYGLAAAGAGLVASTVLYVTTAVPPALTATLHYLDGIALMVFVVTLALVYEHFKRRALDELASANAMLAAEMRERTRIEADLRLAQKLESVGRLAAGISHEIATPVQFVRDTTAFATEAMSDVLAILSHHQAVTQAVLERRDARDVAACAAAFEAGSDLPYYVEELPPSLARMSEGLDRIASIIRSMRQLVHPTQQDLADVDLDTEIANTLALAVNEYRDVADLETRFAGLPPVACRAGEINQVVLNLVINASHAIRDAVGTTATRGTLVVSTRLDGDVAEIAVTDSGGGIPETIRDKIFDPFFTTKSVGRGTGQGLAIARSALERHGGTLTFESTLGVGTTFRARLPVLAARPSMHGITAPAHAA